MFKSTPTPSRLMSRDDPPELMKGNGMPFVGRRLVTTLILMKAWQTIIIVSPTPR